MSDPFAGTEAADITERLRAEIERLQAQSDEWEQAAGVEAGLRREFQANNERLRAALQSMVDDYEFFWGKQCDGWKSVDQARRALEQK